MTPLSPEMVMQLRKEGYNQKEIDEALEEINREEQFKAMANKFVVQSQNMPSQISPFSFNPNDNMIKWQLELNEILERAEHMLREDEITIVNGQTRWTANKRENERILTDYGVNEIMRILSMYLNRDIILGNYGLDEVNDKVYDFGIELNDLFFMKYESMFSVESLERIQARLYPDKIKLTRMEELLTEQERDSQALEKRKNYPMIIRMLVDIVHATYTRGIGGGERNSLREARQFNQSEVINPYQPQGQPNQMQIQSRSVFNPARYIFGKYK